jgi:RNA polymerase sigma-70 factor, ECF subfamily
MRQDDRLRAVLYLNGLRGSDLEDALQEVHARTLARPPADAGARDRWQAVVAVNIALDHHRRAKREADLAMRMHAAEAPRQQTQDPDVLLREVVSRGLAALDPGWRAVVVLRFYEDRSLEQIAEDLDLPIGTVKSRLHRAVQQLRGSLPREEVMR